MSPMTSPKTIPPAEIRPEQITAIVDSREQMPLELAPLRSIVGTCLPGTIPSKDSKTSWPWNARDFPTFSVASASSGSDSTAKSYGYSPTPAVPWSSKRLGATWNRRVANQVTPAAAIGSVLGWVAAGLPIIMAGDHERAGRYVGRLLFTAARRRANPGADRPGAARGRAGRGLPGGLTFPAERAKMKALKVCETR